MAVVLLFWFSLALFVAGLWAFAGALRKTAKPDRELMQADLLLRRVESDTYFVAISDAGLRDEIRQFNRRHARELSR